MATQGSGLLHLHLRKRLHVHKEHFPSKDKAKRFYDKFIYVIAILAPLTNLPQLVKIIIDQNAGGVSAVSWFCFAIFSIAWLTYGIIHKARPIIIMNTFLFLIQLTVGIVALIY